MSDTMTNDQILKAIRQQNFRLVSYHPYKTGTVYTSYIKEMDRSNPDDEQLATVMNMAFDLACSRLDLYRDNKTAVGIKLDNDQIVYLVDYDFKRVICTEIRPEGTFDL